MKSLVPADPSTTVGEENVVKFCCSFNLRVKKSPLILKLQKTNDWCLLFNKQETGRKRK